VLSKAARPRGVEFADPVLSRIKVMSELDIAERRIPQDGRFQLLFQDRAVDFRVCVMPSIHSEDAVLRVLDKQSLADQVRGLRLDLLGLDAAVVLAIRELAARHRPAPRTAGHRRSAGAAPAPEERRVVGRLCAGPGLAHRAARRGVLLGHARGCGTGPAHVEPRNRS